MTSNRSGACSCSALAADDSGKVLFSSDQHQSAGDNRPIISGDGNKFKNGNDSDDLKRQTQQFHKREFSTAKTEELLAFEFHGLFACRVIYRACRCNGTG